jgi:hypothetical protein
MRTLVVKEFERGATVPIVRFPEESTSVQDSPKLILVLMDPGVEWPGDQVLRGQVAEWTRKKGMSDSLYPGSLVWCFKKGGRD